MRRRDLKFPIASGDSRVARCLQGGGVYVQGGTVAISSCTIYGNTADLVRSCSKVAHRPNGKIADVPAPALARTTTADAPVNYNMQPVRAAKTCNYAIALMGRLLTQLSRLTLAQLRG